MISKLFDLTDKVAIVTGASSGLGVTFAHGLAEAGADVVIAARRLKQLEETAKGVRERDRKCLVVQTDVTQPDQVDNMVSETIQEFGKVDILVNNAGRGGMGMWADSAKVEEFKTILEANLVSAFLCTQRAGQEMLKRGYGRIINISSIEGTLAAPTEDPSASYVPSKFGLEGLTKECAKQWARRGVTVNSIAPAFFRTELTERFYEDPKILKLISERAPMGRVGDPPELLGALIFLA
ncbi:MAG: SDR family NAD(P)-dependent oxidoreductase, partial [Dehalococcoidia bacterium]